MNVDFGWKLALIVRVARFAGHTAEVYPVHPGGFKPLHGIELPWIALLQLGIASDL